MKSLPISVLFAAVACSACATGGDKTQPAARETASARQRGSEVVSEYLKRDAAPYRQVTMRLTVTSPTEPAKIYELKVSRKQSADETLTLTEIEQPLAERNASLTIEQKGRDAVSVTYASALGRFRETGTGKMFFGGVTAQEFLGEWDKYDYRLTDERELGGIKVHEVEALLKPGRDSIIARFIVDFRADTYLPAELHVFNSDRESLRDFQIKDYREFDGRPFIARTEIENVVHQTKLVVETLNVTFPQRMDDSLFTREHLQEISQR